MNGNIGSSNSWMHRFFTAIRNCFKFNHKLRHISKNVNEGHNLIPLLDISVVKSHKQISLHPSLRQV